MMFLSRWAFQIYDEDNSGMIDQDEMTNVMTVKYQPETDQLTDVNLSVSVQNVGGNGQQTFWRPQDKS